MSYLIRLFFYLIRLFWLFKMTFHNLQNSLLYRLKTQVIALSKFPPGGSPRTLLAHSLGSPTVLNSSLRVWIPHVIDKKFQLGSRGKGFWSFAFINIYMHACKWGEFCGCAQRNFCLLRNQKWRSFKISTDQSRLKSRLTRRLCWKETATHCLEQRLNVSTV